MQNLTEQIIMYESGDLTESQTHQLFQHLIDSGLVYMLQGHYGRTAEALIADGFCQRWPAPAGSPPMLVPTGWLPPGGVLGTFTTRSQFFQILRFGGKIV